MTTAEREAARQRIREHEQAERNLMARWSAPGFAALTACNGCDLDDAHPGCEAGYCHGCCPEH